MRARRVLVTGCSSGIGKATAHFFHAHDWHVFATARRDEDLARLDAAGFTPVPLELADATSVANAADAVLAHGPLDVLVNNAGFGLVKPIEETTRDEWDALLAANVSGPMDLARRVLPGMRDAGGGAVVNVGSVAGRDGFAFIGAYAAAKTALAAASDALRVEARPWNVRVSLVEPAPARTRFAGTALAGAPAADASAYARTYARLARFDNVVRKGIDPERVARAIHRTATRKRPPARVPVGVLAHLGRFTRVVPAPVRRGVYALALGLTSSSRRTRPPS